MRKLAVLATPLTLALSASAFAEGRPTTREETSADVPEGARIAGDTPQGDATRADDEIRARLPGFAAVLANRPPIKDASAWKVLSERDAWHAIASSSPGSRQSARWMYARSLIGKERWAEAYGVLVAMEQDDPDLALVPAYQLALGAALVGLDGHLDALDRLAAEQLAQNSEACAWRLRAFAALERNAEAVRQWACARPAIASRAGEQRHPFLLAVAEAALHEGKPDSAIALLKPLTDSNASANLIRGRALFLLGSEQEARLRLDRAAENGTTEQRVDAQVSLFEGLLEHRKAVPSNAAAELDRIGFTWRGGPIERRALELRFRLAKAWDDDRATLATGAALMRYHPMAGNSGAMLSTLQDTLSSILSPKSTVPLPEAAGLFWEYRDLAPSGAGGDYLVSRLANRLIEAELYQRAAELMDYQLTARTKDVAQGPLSVRVAKLYLMADEPEEALRALRDTDDNIYPATMRFARLRIEAVALHKLGRTDEALAVLDGVPEGGAVRQEIEWDRGNWQALTGSQDLPTATNGRLSEVEQTVILRRAVALAMLGRERSLAGLRARYAPAFANQQTEAAFDMLTGPVDALDPETVSQAMAAMPAASPAGDIADLLAGTAAKTKPAVS